MVEVLERKNVVQLDSADIERLSNSLKEPSWMRDLRLAAYAQYEEAEMPKWRRTNLSLVRLEELEVGQPMRLEMSTALGKVVFTSLSDALHEDGSLIRPHLEKLYATQPDSKLELLARALWQGGTLLYLPKDVSASENLNSRLEAAGGSGVQAGLTLVIAEANTSCTLAQDLCGQGEAPCLYTEMTYIAAGQNANVALTTLQNLPKDALYFSANRSHSDREASVRWLFGSFGGRLQRTTATARLEGVGGYAELLGLWFGKEKQHFSFKTLQDHIAPHCKSDLLFKGTLKDRARSVYEAMINVRPGAQKSDAYQSNRNLLLSNQCRADSIPGLEIEADDVRCTHGATVGQIDAEQMFYLNARGLTRPDAEKLLIEAFFSEVLDRIPNKELGHSVMELVDAAICGCSL